jgi:hypothetical protein
VKGRFALNFRRWDAVVARMIEVTRMPEILMSQREDIERGINKLESELQE